MNFFYQLAYFGLVLTQAHFHHNRSVPGNKLKELILDEEVVGWVDSNTKMYLGPGILWSGRALNFIEHHFSQYKSPNRNKIYNYK